MLGIRTATIFKPMKTEEEKKALEEKKNARKWVEFPKTDCHRGWHSVVHRIDNWRQTTTVEELQKLTLQIGATCFRYGTGHGHPAAITDASFEIAPKHMNHQPDCTTWWYKPVWDD